MTGRFQANDVKALIAAALNGFGIVLGPEAAVKEDLAEGQLVHLLSNYEAPERPMHLVFTTRRSTPKLRSFIDLVVSTFGARKTDTRPS